MSIKEKPQANPQIRLGLEPAEIPTDEGGFYVDTRPFLEEKFEADLKLAWAGATSFVSPETARSYFNSRIPYSRGRITWTRAYAELVEKQAKDIMQARAEDGQKHHKQVEVIEKNTYFAGLQFYRDMLNSQERRPGTVISLKNAGLVALRRSLNPNLPDFERLELEFLGVSLSIKSRRIDRETHPLSIYQDSSIVYYLKQEYAERDEAEKKRRKDLRREAAEKGKANPKVDLEQESNWSERCSYADKVAEWTLKYQEEAGAEYVPWYEESIMRYQKLARAASLQRFNPYDAPKSRKYELYDYDKVQGDPEHDPLFVGLIMLRTAPKTPKRRFKEYEERGFESLISEFNKANLTIENPEKRRKWKAWVAFVIKQEYLYKKSLLEPKGQTMRTEMQDEIRRANLRHIEKAKYHIPIGI